jgi:hypothetical protein
MTIEIRKVISAPLIKKVVEQVCKDTGVSPTDYAYSLILDDVNRRISNNQLCTDLANDRLSPKTFLAEICRVVEKYEKSISAK